MSCFYFVKIKISSLSKGVIIFVQSLRRYNFLIFEIDLIKIFVSSNLLVKKKIIGIDPSII